MRCAEGTDPANEREVVEGNCEELVGLLIECQLRAGFGLACSISSDRCSGRAPSSGRLSMLLEVARFVFGDEVVEGAGHEGEKAVVFARDGCCDDTFFVCKQMAVVNVER